MNLEKAKCDKCNVEGQIWCIDSDGVLVYRCPKCGSIYREDRKPVRRWD